MNVIEYAKIIVKFTDGTKKSLVKMMLEITFKIGYLI